MQIFTIGRHLLCNIPCQETVVSPCLFFLFRTVFCNLFVCFSWGLQSAVSTAVQYSSGSCEKCSVLWQRRQGLLHKQMINSIVFHKQQEKIKSMFILAQQSQSKALFSHQNVSICYIGMSSQFFFKLSLNIFNLRFHQDQLGVSKKHIYIYIYIFFLKVFCSK